MAIDDVATIAVEVVMSPAAGQLQRVGISLPLGASVRDALRLSGLCPQAAEGDAEAPHVGVWGQRRPLAHVLRDRDRVEIYRPLLIEPKDARRQRQRRQQAAKR